MYACVFVYKYKVSAMAAATQHHLMHEIHSLNNNLSTYGLKQHRMEKHTQTLFIDTAHSLKAIEVL